MPDHDAPVTASEAASRLKVSIAVICMWRNKGWKDPETKKSRYLEVVGRRGRSPLYLWGDLLVAERDTNQSPKSRRKRKVAA